MRPREFNIEADAAANAVLDSTSFTRAGLAAYRQGPELPEQHSLIICTDGALRQGRTPQAAGGWIVRRIQLAATRRIFVGGRRLGANQADSSIIGVDRPQNMVKTNKLY